MFFCPNGEGHPSILPAAPSYPYPTLAMDPTVPFARGRGSLLHNGPYGDGERGRGIRTVRVGQEGILPYHLHPTFQPSFLSYLKGRLGQARSRRNGSTGYGRGPTQYGEGGKEGAVSERLNVSPVRPIVESQCRGREKCNKGPVKNPKKKKNKICFIVLLIVHRIVY